MDGLRSGQQVPNTIIMGDSRSGKTATVKLYVQALACSKRDSEMLSPCGRCETCRGNVGRYDHRGVFVNLTLGQSPAKRELHYMPIDCTRIGSTELRDVLDDFRDYGGLRIIYLDEVFRLKTRAMDEMLLKPLEELNYVWLASSVSVKDLDRMFLNRFPVKLRTQLPTLEELSDWLVARCQQWEIEWDDAETLIRLVERANYSPGKTLHVLAAVSSKASRLLTRGVVESHIFDDDG